MMQSCWSLQCDDMAASRGPGLRRPLLTSADDMFHTVIQQTGEAPCAESCLRVEIHKIAHEHEMQQLKAQVSRPQACPRILSVAYKLFSTISSCRIGTQNATTQHCRAGPGAQLSPDACSSQRGRVWSVVQVSNSLGRPHQEHSSLQLRVRSTTNCSKPALLCARQTAHSQVALCIHLASHHSNNQ